MTEKDLENIIIFLLVVVIIYMIYKRNEKMTSNNQTSEESLRDNIVLAQESVKHEPTKHEPTKPEPTKPEPTKPEPTKPDTNIIEGVSNDRFGKSIDEKCEQVEQKKFIDEYMNYSRFGNNIEKITTDDEINAYRKSFLDFRNVTNQTSHGFDPVDQMNLDKISGLYQGGLKIHEVYDKIAAKNFDTSKIDLYSMQMNERIDDTIRSNTFEYDNDEVSNGGFFFEKIKGNENSNELKAFP